MTDEPLELPAPPGYGRVVALDRERHAGLAPAADCRARFARDRHLLYLAADEFFQAALDYPIGFVEDAGAGHAVPVALLGLEEGQNLFVDARGEWRAGHYVPAVVRRYPFCVVRVRGGERDERRLIGVDEAALVASDRPLFTRDGEDTPRWRSLSALIDRLEGAYDRTVTFCRNIEAQALFAPFAVRAQLADGRRFAVDGLRRIDEEKLAALPAERVLEWFGDGTLARVHAHLVSLNQLARFPERCV